MVNICFLIPVHGAKKPAKPVKVFLLAEKVQMCFYNELYKSQYDNTTLQLRTKKYILASLQA